MTMSHTSSSTSKGIRILNLESELKKSILANEETSRLLSVATTKYFKLEERYRLLEEDRNNLYTYLQQERQKLNRRQ